MAPARVEVGGGSHVIMPDPTVLAAILLPIVMAAALALWARRRRRVARALGDAPLLARAMRIDPSPFPWTRAILILAATASLALALPGPPGVTAGTRATGAVVLVLDVSNSMLTADVPPSRLDVMRGATARLTQGLDRVPLGMVIFAGQAYTLTPPTLDDSAIRLYLDALDPGMVTQTGSSISAAIRQGLALLASADAGRGALVLVSDGEISEAEDSVRAAVALARNAGVPVHTLGVGTAAGGEVPDVDPARGTPVGYQRGPSGAPIISRLDEALLRRIAAETGASYGSLSNRGAIPRATAALLEAQAGGSVTSVRPPWQTWLAVAAFLLLSLEAVFWRPRAAAPIP